MTPRRHGGFSLVELLVVLSIIGLLLAMAAAGFVLVRQSAMQAEAASNVRQLGLAWEQYSVDHLDRLVPGLMSPEAQAYQKSYLAYPDLQPISPAPSFSTSLPNTAGPWTWRLVPYLNNALTLLRSTSTRYDVPLNQYEEVGEEVAWKPAFSYNGWYVGGHLRIESGRSNPTVAFNKARIGDRKRENLVVDSHARFQRPGNIIIFTPGHHFDDLGGITMDTQDVSPWFEVTPRYLADVEQWRSPVPNQIEAVAVGASVPTGRGGVRAPAYHGDGHTESLGIEELADQSRWIDGARKVDDVPARDFTHEAE